MMNAEQMADLLLERLGLDQAEELAKLMAADLDAIRGDGREDQTVWQKPALYFALVTLTTDARARTKSGADLGKEEAQQKTIEASGKWGKAIDAAAKDGPKHVLFSYPPVGVGREVYTCGCLATNNRWDTVCDAHKGVFTVGARRWSGS